MSWVQINRKLLLMKIHYFIGIGGYGPFAPFLSTISKQRGYSAVIVGFIFMVQPIPGLLFRPLIGIITDKYKCRRLVFTGSSIIIFMLVGLLLVIPGATSKIEINDLDVVKTPLFWLFFGTISIINVNAMVKSAMEETVCMDLLGESIHNYGKQRLWGSIGWSLLATISGVCVDCYSKGLESKDYTPAYVLALICFFLDIFVVLKLKIIQKNEKIVLISNVKKVFTEGKVLVFLFWVLLFGFFMSFVWNYVFWYLEDLANIYRPEIKPWMKTIQGLALVIQCFFGEVPSFFLSSHILKRMDHMAVFTLVFFMFSVIFSAYSLITNPLWILPFEMLNGVMFGLANAVAVSYANLISPSGAEGTLQAMVGTAMTGIGAPIGSIVGGYMFKNIGSTASFKLCAVIVFFTCITQIFVNYLISRYTENEVTKDVYCKVDIEDNVKENHENLTPL